jgi:multisubunit Na+/H+ antiporter MnhG subunit
MDGFQLALMVAGVVVLVVAVIGNRFIGRGARYSGTPGSERSPAEVMV